MWSLGISIKEATAGLGGAGRGMEATLSLGNPSVAVVEAVAQGGHRYLVRRVVCG
jgi:hypothetical protein